MRAGSLNMRAEVLELDPDCAVRPVMRRWVSLRAKDAGDVAAPSGLRSAGMVEVRGWFSGEYQAGRYIRIGDRLLVIADPRDPMGNGAEIVVSCYELTGQPATYNGKACRVHLAHNAPWLDDMGQVTAYKTRAEVALIETGRVQVGDQLIVSGTTYNVIAYADDSDDGIVRGLWLEQV